VSEWRKIQRVGCSTKSVALKTHKCDEHLSDTLIKCKEGPYTSTPALVTPSYTVHIEEATYMVGLYEVRKLNERLIIMLCVMLARYKTA